MTYKFILSSSVLILGQFAFAGFSIFAAETNAFSQGGNTAAYGGIQRYNFASNNAPAIAGPGVAASALHDPAGLVYRNNNLYVMNRHGNTIGQGSVQKMAWNGSSLGAPTTIATQSSPAYQGFHGGNFAPNGDLFQTTVSNGTRRYRDTGSGYVDIGGVASGDVRDAWVSPDGKKLWETTAGGQLRVTDILANSFGGTTIVSIGGGALHQMARRGNSIYATVFQSGQVRRIDFDANYMPTGHTAVASSSSALGIAFSPDGNEMFVSGHQSNQIERFGFSSGLWISNGNFATGHNMGYLAMVPEPASMIALAAGAALLLRRRKN
ncbi:MAG: PEP-CTERM sorting domain-containing protein [Chthonomonas sp.]|nr:PEP-CTERM sorting domain-containing protein [Chthonomonas sp.]